MQSAAGYPEEEPLKPGGVIVFALIVLALGSVAPTNAARVAMDAQLGSADTIRPRVRALASSGQAGKPIRLRYRVSDNGGRTRERIDILRRGKRVKRLSTRFGASRPGTTYFLRWKPPRRFSGTYRFCVTARDPAGNKSRRSCARLKIGRPPPAPAPPSRECHPSYRGACLDPSVSDYDCRGGSGNGPGYTGPVTVVGPDEYGLDADSDGRACERS